MLFLRECESTELLGNIFDEKAFLTTRWRYIGVELLVLASRLEAMTTRLDSTRLDSRTRLDSAARTEGAGNDGQDDDVLTRSTYVEGDEGGDDEDADSVEALPVVFSPRKDDQIAS